MSTSKRRKNPTIFPYQGRWRVVVPLANGKTRTHTVDTEQDGYDLLVTEGLTLPGRFTPSRVRESPKLDDWMVRWFERHHDDLRAKTVRNHLSLNKNHISPALGKYRLDDLTPMLIEDFYRTLMVVKGLAATSVHRIHATLSPALKGAMRYNLMTSNPLDHVKKPRKPARRITPLTKDESEAVLRIAQQHGPLQHFRWLIAIRFGLRQGESLGLHWADIDFGAATLSVTKQLQRIPHQGFELVPPKSDRGTRVIPLDTETLHIAQLARDSQLFRTGFVFASEEGKPMHPSSDRRDWLLLLKAAGLPPKSLHSARHTAATQLILAGVDVRTTQLILGHSTPAFTLATYVHPDIESIRTQVNRVFGRSQNG